MQKAIYLATILFLGATGCSDNTSRPAGPAQPSPNALPELSTRTSRSVSLIQFKDLETGTIWNFKGEAIEGELAGKKLTQIPAYSAYWFAWASFWKDTAVWEPGDTSDPVGALEGVRLSELRPSVSTDAIPPLDDPPTDFGQAEFVSAERAVLPSDDDLVVGVAINGDARAYPVKILNWHEIVNHTVGGKKISLTYCPLTASAISFEGDRITFGNSGVLFNNNLVMYDRETRSLWSQMRLRSIQGPKLGTGLNMLPVVQTTWAAWKALYPQTTILSPNTGYDRDYQNDIFEQNGYTTTSVIYFSQTPPIDSRFHPKDMVFGLLKDTLARAYPYPSMGNQSVINDTFAGQATLVVYQKNARLALAFSREVDGRVLNFVLAF